jgi:hypothetical protein
MITQKASRLAYPFIAALALGLSLASYAADPAYFTKYESMQTTPGNQGSSGCGDDNKQRSVFTSALALALQGSVRTHGLNQGTR